MIFSDLPWDVSGCHTMTSANAPSASSRASARHGAIWRRATAGSRGSEPAHSPPSAYSPTSRRRSHPDSCCLCPGIIKNSLTAGARLKISLPNSGKRDLKESPAAQKGRSRFGVFIIYIDHPYYNVGITLLLMLGKNLVPFIASPESKYSNPDHANHADYKRQYAEYCNDNFNHSLILMLS